MKCKYFNSNLVGEPTSKDELIEQFNLTKTLTICPICGNITFGIGSICSRCGWEEDIMRNKYEKSPANGCSINRYKKEYRHYLKKCKQNDKAR